MLNFTKVTIYCFTILTERREFSFNIHKHKGIQLIKKSNTKQYLKLPYILQP